MFAPELTPQMKYHYQYVSKNSVRIELIAEDAKEKAVLKSLSTQSEDNETLAGLFHLALENYKSGSALTKCNFMNFPAVALCSFSEKMLTVEKVA